MDAGAAEVLGKKTNMRVVTARFDALLTGVEQRSLLGAMLVQQRDVVAEARQPWSATILPEGLRVVTKRAPTAEEWGALRFAWRVAHREVERRDLHRRALHAAIGAGQMSRVDAVNVAVMKERAGSRSLRGAVAASERVLPVPRRPRRRGDSRASAVVQPGLLGARRRGEIAAADDMGWRWSLQESGISDTSPA